MPTVNISEENLEILDIILDSHERLLLSRENMPPLSLTSALNDVESIRTALGLIEG